MIMQEEQGTEHFSILIRIEQSFFFPFFLTPKESKQVDANGLGVVQKKNHLLMTRGTIPSFHF